MEQRIAELAAEHGSVKYGSLIACIPFAIMAALSLLTGVAPAYGLSCWATLLGLAWLVAWFTRGDGTRQTARQLHYLIGRWFDLLDRCVVGRWLVLYKTHESHEVGIMLCHEQVVNVTAFSWPLGGWIVRTRAQSRFGRLKHIRLKRCIIDPRLGMVNIVFVDADGNKPTFTDPVNALEWLNEVRPDEELCWPAFERITHERRDRAEKVLELQRELVRQPTPRLQRAGHDRPDASA